MNKRQMKKMRQLRLENERLREAQQVRLETEFAMQQTNARVDDLHGEICRLRQSNMMMLQTQNQLVDQQAYLNQQAKLGRNDIQQLKYKQTRLERRTAALEKVDRRSALLAAVAGMGIILLIAGAMIL